MPSTTNVQHWQDVSSIASIASYASSYVESANQYMTKQPLPQDNDVADFNTSKRRIEWIVKNFRGGQNRTLEISLTYKKGVVIDEL